jgi:beta-lactamase regulating signal transducer with metallopeptidase domain
MTEALVVALLLAALRSAVLGLGVSIVVGLFRLRDEKAETVIWTTVLWAAVAMPVLTLVLPQALHLPLPVSAARVAGSTLALAKSSPAAGPSLPILVALAYAAGVLLFLGRMAAGLAMLLRLYLKAEPVTEAWARGRPVRFSAAVDGPLSFAGCILLPADYRLWPEIHRAAVMAHEECHIRRGDFFIQLLASLHRALFWFSPFAWWLQRKLGELAETASDAAGARRIGDPASYAEILVDVARDARRRPVGAAAAMAHGPGLARRVDHILAPPSGRPIGAAGRALALAGVAAASLALAEIHAAAAQSVQTSGSIPTSRTEGRKPPARAAQTSAARAPSPAKVVHARKATYEPAAPPPAPVAAAPAGKEEVSYDPLAALRDRDVVAALPVVLSTRVAQ